MAEIIEGRQHVRLECATGGGGGGSSCSRASVPLALRIAAVNGLCFFHTLLTSRSTDKSTPGT